MKTYELPAQPQLLLPHFRAGDLCAMGFQVKIIACHRYIEIVEKSLLYIILLYKLFSDLAVLIPDVFRDWGMEYF